MRRSPLPLAIVLLVLAAGHVAAEDDAAKIDCSEPSSTVEINVCADRELAEADKALNVMYEKALATVPEFAVDDDPNFSAKSWEKALRNSQRAWLKFRDAECKDHVPMFWGGGTGTTAAVLGCMITKTKSRTEELKESYLKANR